MKPLLPMGLTSSQQFLHTQYQAGSRDTLADGSVAIILYLGDIIISVLTGYMARWLPWKHAGFIWPQIMLLAHFNAYVLSTYHTFFKQTLC